MSKTCLKCGYEKAEQPFHELACPQCGAIYHKLDEIVAKGGVIRRIKIEKTKSLEPPQSQISSDENQINFDNPVVLKHQRVSRLILLPILVVSGAALFALDGQLTSNQAMFWAGIGFLLGMVGDRIKKSHPRSAFALMGIWMLTIGLWAVVSTQELARQGRAHTFSRSATTFAKADASSAFEWSFWFHLLLGGAFFFLGLSSIVLSFTKAEKPFEPDR